MSTTSALSNLRSLPFRPPPLPRLTPTFSQEASVSQTEERYEVVIAGAGPAGLMLELLLARYGLSDESLLCIDQKSKSLRAGQADGLQPRTLEVFKSLGLLDEILTQGCQMWEITFWNPKEPPSSGDNLMHRGIERTSILPDVAVASRYPHEVTIHQGRIERILEDDLRRFSTRGVQRSTKLLDAKIDETDAEFPVVAELETSEGRHRKVRSKYLVGADGAHSIVRQCMGLKLEGESLDHIWGVIDLVVDTDFPDIRRRTAIHSDAGSIMVIPRERIDTGDYLTRLYVQVPEVEDVDPTTGQPVSNGSVNEDRSNHRNRRAKVTVEGMMSQVGEVMKPYYIRQKDGTEIDWWTAYQIGQRLTKEFALKDSRGKQRVFIAGDACHTHSPKAGQGMNVSMMDSYNLAWKLAHAIHGLTPDSVDPLGPDNILETYQTERHTIAQELIDFDREFSSMFSGKIGAGEGEGLSHEQFLDVFSTGNGFTSGCGIEYPESNIVERADTDKAIHSKDFLSGVLRPGRRLHNVRVKRHADGVPRDLQDDFPSTGRFRILCLTSKDLLDPQGTSAKTLDLICTKLLPRFYEKTIELVVVHPRLRRYFVWKDIPAAVKTHSEMLLHSAEFDDVYEIYGVKEDQGVISVVRPDGYIGTIAALSDVPRIERYLARCLRTV